MSMWVEEEDDEDYIKYISTTCYVHVPDLQTYLSYYNTSASIPSRRRENEPVIVPWFESDYSDDDDQGTKSNKPGNDIQREIREAVGTRYNNQVLETHYTGCQNNPKSASGSPTEMPEQKSSNVVKTQNTPGTPGPSSEEYNGVKNQNTPIPLNQASKAWGSPMTPTRAYRGGRGGKKQNIPRTAGPSSVEYNGVKNNTPIPPNQASKSEGSPMTPTWSSRGGRGAKKQNSPRPPNWTPKKQNTTEDLPWPFSTKKEELNIYSAKDFPPL